MHLVKDEAYNRELTKFRDSSQEAFLSDYVFDLQGHKAVGFKFKHEELFLPEFKPSLDFIASDHQIRIVLLRRENLFERLASWWIVNKVTGITEVHSDNDRPVIRPFQISAKLCEEDFDLVTRQYETTKALMRKHQILEVSYEDLTGEESSQSFERVLDFLEVSQVPLKSRLKKIVTSSLHDIVENYEELKQYFKDTKYGSFFG